MTTAERRRWLLVILEDAIGRVPRECECAECKALCFQRDKLADRIESLFVETEGATS